MAPSIKTASEAAAIKRIEGLLLQLRRQAGDVASPRTALFQELDAQIAAATTFLDVEQISQDEEFWTIIFASELDPFIGTRDLLLKSQIASHAALLVHVLMTLSSISVLALGPTWLNHTTSYIECKKLQASASETASSSGFKEDARQSLDGPSKEPVVVKCSILHPGGMTRRATVRFEMKDWLKKIMVAGECEKVRVGGSAGGLAKL